jgi:putative ABC transport system permease protein
LQRGRLISDDDINAARLVMVVNETFARTYFPNEDTIGRKVKLEVLDRPFLDAPRNAYFEIIGIVGDYKARDYESRSWHAFPETFISYSVQGFSHRTYMARTAMDPGLLLKNMNKEMQAIDPAVEIAESGTVEAGLREFYRGPQFELVALGAFATVGLALVMIGIYSVMAYRVSLQTHEIGIRMALGARRGNILSMVLTESMGLIAAGVLIGLAVSYSATRFLASEISGISVTDPWTFGGVAAVVVAVGLFACSLPALRAARVDPLVALRYE